MTAGVIGNTLEWYDFAIFGFLAPYITTAFFPESDRVAGLIQTFGVFAVGYLMRPLGAFIFGHIGDRVGRRQALFLSVLLMAIPTFLLGLLPGYETIGILAPILLLVLRLLQGLSVGGEFAASITFVGELSANHRRGLLGSLTMIGAIGGFILGSGVSELATLVMDQETLTAWGWRVPFLLGLALAVAGLWMRRSLPNSDTFEQNAMAHDSTPHPLVDVCRNQWRRLLTLASLVFMQGIGFYMIFVWLPVYLGTILKREQTQPLLLNTCALAILMGSIIAAGWLSDRIGRRPLLLTSALLLGTVAWPFFSLLQVGSVTTIFWVMAVFAVIIGFAQGPTPAMMTELFPTRSRLTGIGIGYNVTQAIAGGTAPAFCTWLVMSTGIDGAPAFYLIASAVVGLIGAAVLTETRGRSLLVDPTVASAN
ncbi:MAG: MFS transporter [Planctomycetota bacterium]|nr:MFS transporter [Planctomycetota bacterium]